MIFRHAKSQPTSKKIADKERSLKPVGQDASRKVGKELKILNLVPEAIYSSDARRAEETIKIACEEMAFGGNTVFLQELYQSSPEIYRSLISRMDKGNNCILIVGHNPVIEDFLREATGDEIDMSAGSVAHLEYGVEDWGEISSGTKAILRRLIKP